MTNLSDTQRVILSKAAQHVALLAEPPKQLPAAARQSVVRSLMAKGLLAEAPAPREATALAWRQDEDGAWIALRITDAGLRAIGVDAADALPKDSEPVLPQPTAPSETADLLTAPQGESQAAPRCAPPLASGETAQGPQRPPVSQHGARGRTATLRMASTTVLAAWDAPERDGLDDALAALREVLAATPQVARGSRPPRDPAVPRQPRIGTKQEAVLALLRRDEGANIAQIMDVTGWQQHTVRGFLAGLKPKGVTVGVLERIRQVGPNKQGAMGSYSIYRIATATPAEAG